MIIRDARRLALVLVPVLLFLYGSFVLLSHHDPALTTASKATAWLGNSAKKLVGAKGKAGSNILTSSPDYHELTALSTRNGSFFAIDMSPSQAINPNVIPHPRLANTWIVVAQNIREDNLAEFTEIACNAIFIQDRAANDVSLHCLDAPVPLPIRPTAANGDHCVGDLSYFNLNVGPHDARVLMGPRRPYIVFGSNSRHTCFGQFIQDLDPLLSDDDRFSHHHGYGNTDNNNPDFPQAADLQRPLPWGAVEKNWFPFWDADDNMYVHYDVSPSRVFARLNADGSAGPDLAVHVRAADDACMKRYMPAVGLQGFKESLHQATNSLRVTMCNRRGPDACAPNDDNTYIFTIYQHKTFHNLHAVYEPFILMFRQKAPFDIVAMSRKPLWIKGRHLNGAREVSEMLYLTSISWKSRGNGYHGFLDDEMFIGFGVEDKWTGGVDLLARDVLGDIGLCGEP